MSTPSTPQRRTRQRAAVAEVLAGHPGFRTAQELHDLLVERGESVGLATVYRTLQSLADAGEADVVRTPDGTNAYSACGQARHHHHHLICRSCGRKVEVEIAEFEDFVDGLAVRHGFTAVDHDVEFFGLCDRCGT